MKIVTFGDSITDVGRTPDRDGNIFGYGHGYPLMVAGELQLENPEKYQLFNRGNSGHRIVDLYARVKKDVWNLQPDVLSILIGINDIWHGLGENPNGVGLERFEKVYRMLIEDTLERLPNVKIMIMEPFVLHGYATDPKFEEFSKVKEYAAAAKRIAEDYGLFFLPLQEKFDEAAKRFPPVYWTDDGVHPTAAGARLIANEWLKLFKEKIDK